jgi:hypothetical protein
VTAAADAGFAGVGTLRLGSRPPKKVEREARRFGF